MALDPRWLEQDNHQDNVHEVASRNTQASPPSLALGQASARRLANQQAGWMASKPANRSAVGPFQKKKYLKKNHDRKFHGPACQNGVSAPSSLAGCAAGQSANTRVKRSSTSGRPRSTCSFMRADASLLLRLGINIFRPQVCIHLVGSRRHRHPQNMITSGVGWPASRQAGFV